MDFSSRLNPMEKNMQGVLSFTIFDRFLPFIFQFIMNQAIVEEGESPEEDSRYIRYPDSMAAAKKITLNTKIKIRHPRFKGYKLDDKGVYHVRYDIIHSLNIVMNNFKIDIQRISQDKFLIAITSVNIISDISDVMMIKSIMNMMVAVHIGRLKNKFRLENINGQFIELFDDVPYFKLLF